MDNEKKNNGQETGQPQEQAIPKQSPGKMPSYHTGSFAVPSIMPKFDQILSRNDEISMPSKAESSDGGSFVKDIVEKLSKDSSEIKSDSSIPSFDLAKGLLSEERMLSSLGRSRKKRVSPSIPKPQQPLVSLQEIKPLGKPEPVVFEQPRYSASPQSPQHKIISEIVAREIASLLAIPSAV